MCLCVVSEKVTIVTNAGAQFSKPSVCCSPSSPPGLRKKDMKVGGRGGAYLQHLEARAGGLEVRPDGRSRELSEKSRKQQRGLTARQNQSVSVW